MKKNSLYDSLSEEPKMPSGPVTCFGMTFENDEARRAYFTEELRKKLRDPEFRKIEGFPVGEDEDILALSDPPYYTACPNPWIADFIAEWEADKKRITGSESPLTVTNAEQPISSNQKPFHRNPITVNLLPPM